MSPIISEILKIKADSTLTLDGPAFSSLRETPIKFGVKEQYYGRCTDEPDTLIWVVHWPKDVNPMDHTRNDMQAFRKSVREIDVNSNPSSWYLPFDSADLVRPALTAPVCQLCSILLSCDKALLADSLHKTFTDCYYASGFVGGYWATALNDDKRHYYYLGWETRELHDAYAKTELFAEEINKLIPHTAEGTTNYIKMIPHYS